MSVIEVTDIKEKAERKLLDLLQEVQGHKLLILDSDLSGPLSLIVTFSVLQQHGIDKIYYLHDGPPPDTSSSQINLVYLMRPTEQNISYLNSHIKRLSSIQGTNYDFTVLFTPRRTLAVDLLLEEKGIAGDINVLTFPLGFIPMDDDLLSLELPNAGVEDLYLRGISSPIYHSALALQDIQVSYGAFPRITGKGNNAREMADILRRLQEEADVSRNSIEKNQPSSFLLERLIIIERSDDFISPLLCQLTYEGLIDELYCIKNGQVELPNSIAAPSQENEVSTGSSSSSTNPQGPDRRRTKKVSLDPRDPLFRDLRDMNFASVGTTLNKIAKKLSEDYEERHQAKTVSQIKEFVNKLGSLQTEHQSLRMYTALAEAIMNFTQGEAFNKSLEFQQNLVADGLNMTILHRIFEELIYQRIGIKSVLRLWCIECLINNGMKDKDFAFFKTIFLQAYGYQHILTLETLMKMGLLFPRSKPPNSFSFYNLRKQLHLVVDQLDDQQPQDISYVFSGYAPLSLRLVQSALDRRTESKGSRSSTSVPDWRNADDILRNIPGESFELQGTQTPTNAGLSKGLLQADTSSTRATVLYFLGGITYAEIAAIRFLSKQLKGPGEILIATTGIISGDRIMDVALASTPEVPLSS